MTPIVPKEVSKKTAVLFSVSQQCFHLESVFDYISSNIKTSLVMSSGNDYRLICICDSDVEGDAVIEKFKIMQQNFKNKTLDDLLNKALNDE